MEALDAFAEAGTAEQVVLRKRVAVEGPAREANWEVVEEAYHAGEVYERVVEIH